MTKLQLVAENSDSLTVSKKDLSCYNNIIKQIKSVIFINFRRDL